MELRAVRVEDAEALAETVAAGFESFREWAGHGWRPPETGFELWRYREGLERPSLWGLVALDRGEMAGHVMFVQALEREAPRHEIPGLAHLWQLFVRPGWWGSGLATRLNGLAVEEAAHRGYGSMRLFTPSLNARARAFYEREGWATDGVDTFEAMLGLDIVQYRRRL